MNGPIREPVRVSDRDAATALPRPSLNRSYSPTIITSEGNGYEDNAMASHRVQWAEESCVQSDYRDKVQWGKGPMTGGDESDNEQGVVGTDGASTVLGVVRNQSPRRLIVLVLNRKLTLFPILLCYISAGLSISTALGIYSIVHSFICVLFVLEHMRLGPFYSLTVNCKFVYLFSKHLLVICASDNLTQARMMKVKVLLDRLRCEAYLAYTMAEAVGHTD